MRLLVTLPAIFFVFVSMSLSPMAFGANTLKIGFIAPFTGQQSEFGTQMKHGVDLYIAQHGDEVAGRKIEIVTKDTGGIAPATAKREAQELLIQDKVSILAGFNFSPNAFAVAPLATKFGVPMVIMNAATASITTKSPNIVRTSMTMEESAAALADWAYKDDDVRSAYVLVSDYAPGVDWENEVQREFTRLGGKIVGSVRAAVSTVDYVPYIQRAKDAKPDAVFMFVPGGQPSVALFRGIQSTGLREAGIKVLGTGGITDESTLNSYGDAALGIVTSYHYSQAHESSENKAFVLAYLKAFPNDRPNYITVAAYDGMDLIYRALEKTHGDARAQAFIAAVKGMKWTSPRGPVEIDPETRDIVENQYVRRVEKVNGELQNVEFYVYKMVRDPGKLDGKFEYAGSGPIATQANTGS